MNNCYPNADEQLRMAREYFSKVDAGDASLLGVAIFSKVWHRTRKS
jgi:hypothetical protein